MMRTRVKSASPTTTMNGSNTAGTDSVEWEMRPGGMLVQKRTSGSDQAPAPTIRVRVKYGSAHHEVRISSQATFGLYTLHAKRVSIREKLQTLSRLARRLYLKPSHQGSFGVNASNCLKDQDGGEGDCNSYKETDIGACYSEEILERGELKKLLASHTGLHPEDQKLIFKDKERDSKAFLDMTGVKDKAKMVLVEDPQSLERRYLEMRKNAKMEKAAKAIAEISLEVDKLAGQVSSLESVTSRGGKVVEKDVLGLIELLMTQLIKLDGIMADGDVKMQRRMQVRRVQKYVETLDSIKLRNSMIASNQAPGRQQPAVVVTTKWETFDSSPAPPPASSSSKLNWEFFD